MYEDLIKVALLTPQGNPTNPDCVWGQSLILWGSPGTGKSTTIRDVSRRMALPCEVVYAGTRAPEDFSGAPMPNFASAFRGIERLLKAYIEKTLPNLQVLLGKKQPNLSVECILSAANRLCELGEGVLFLDEVSSARPAVQAALCSLVLDRAIGDRILPPGVRVLAAANPPDEAAGGWELEPPLANRFLHANVSPPSVDAWILWRFREDSTWRRQNNAKTMEKVIKGERVGPVKILQEGIIEMWPEVFPRVEGLFLGFVKCKQDLLFSLPAVGSPDRGRAWASPRMWDSAIAAVTTSRCLGMPATLEHVLVAGCVGEAAALEWSTWMANQDLPDPADMLERGWAPDAHRLDRTMVAYLSAVSFVLSKEKSERVHFGNKLWHRIGDLLQAELPDLVEISVQGLLENDLGTEKCTVSRPILQRLYEMGWATVLMQNRL